MWTYCHGLTPVDTEAARSCSLTLSSGTGETIRRVKVRKLVGWDKGSLIGKAKAMCTSKAKQGIHSLLPVSTQVFSHLQESRALSCVIVIWEGKYHHSEQCPFLLLPHGFYCWVWHHAFSQLSQLCLLPTSCSSQAYLLEGWGEEQKRPWHYISMI